MTSLFERVYSEYKKKIIKNGTIKFLRFFLIPYLFFFLFLTIAIKCSSDVRVYPILMCVVMFIIFLSMFFWFRHNNQPTDIVEELQRPEKFKKLLQSFSFQEIRFDSQSRCTKNLCDPIELDCLISDCDTYLSNRLDTVEVFTIVFPLLNCFVSGESIGHLLDSLINSPYALLHLVLIVIIVLMAIVMIFMVFSIVRDLQSLCFPTKKTIVTSMRRDLFYIKRDTEVSNIMADGNTTDPSNYHVAKE